ALHKALAKAPVDRFATAADMAAALAGVSPSLSVPAGRPWRMPTAAAGAVVVIAVAVWMISRGHPAPTMPGNTLAVPPFRVPGPLDRLTVLLLRAGLVPDSAALPTFDLTRPTTTSLVALKAFLAGERFFRRAQPRQAEAEFKRAVAADSTFALAWYRLSAATGWTPSPHWPASTAFDSAALRFAERLPVREALVLR